MNGATLTTHGLQSPPPGYRGPWAGFAPMGGATSSFANQAVPMATGSICILGADGKIVPLVPQSSNANPMASAAMPTFPMANGPAISPLARGLVCILSNGQLAVTTQPVGTMSAQGPTFGPFSANANLSPQAEGTVCFLSNDGRLVPLCA